MTIPDIDEQTQADLKRVDVLPVDGGYKGTYAHFNHGRNGRIAVVTSKAPTSERARDAATRWVLGAAAETETRREWLERTSEIADPSRREPEPGPRYTWDEHPDHKGYYWVVRIDTPEPTPCLEPA